MKKIVFHLLLLSPFTCFAQCPKWIGGSIDNVLLLEKVTEKYLEAPLTRSVEKGDSKHIDFSNDGCRCEFFYATGKALTKKRGEKRATIINSIVIIGPKDKVKKMYTEYFYPLISPCATTRRANFLMNGKTTIAYFPLHVNGRSLAQINMHR